jgi:hypothetical protein
MGTSQEIAVNGMTVWAPVVPLDGGYRVRFDLTDWERLNLYCGQRVPLRLPGQQRDVWIFLVEAVELPPIVWVVLAHRVRSRVG